MTGFAQFQVHLYRDSFNTPWGFRLQGGKDLGQPLTVQRVFSNSPAEGELQRGDIILLIGGKNAQELTHKQAQDFIKFGGGQIQLIVSRPPPGRIDIKSAKKPASVPTRAPTHKATPPKPQQMPHPGSYGFQPKKVNLSKLGGGGPEFGSDFTRPQGMQPLKTSASSTRPVAQQGQMLNRVQESLDNIILSPRTPEAYQSLPSFNEPGCQFYQSPPQSFQSSAPFQQFSQPYTPTFQQVDQYQGEEENYEFVPVWERRKAFLQDQPRKRVIQPVRSTPKVPKPVARPTEGPSFGTDYSKLPKTTAVTWTPQMAAPPPPQQVVQSTTTYYEDNQPPSLPPWRESLRSTGVKPWDTDLDYGSRQPAASDPQPPQPQQPQQPAPQPSAPPQQKSQKNAKPGDRDWNQSAVYRMIHEEERRTVSYSGPPQQQQYQQQQQQQQQKQVQVQQQHHPPQQQKATPRVRSKPQQVYKTQIQINATGLDEELGISDF